MFQNYKLGLNPVSQLAYAERWVNEGSKGYYRKGYINEDGIFVIVMGEKSKW